VPCITPRGIEDAQRADSKALLDIIQVRHQHYLDCVRLFVALDVSPINPAI
jgi:hypothetical protein